MKISDITNISKAGGPDTLRFSIVLNELPGSPEVRGFRLLVTTGSVVPPATSMGKGKWFPLFQAPALFYVELEQLLIASRLPEKFPVYEWPERFKEGN